MRRIVLVIALIWAALFAAGAVNPSTADAQTATPTVTVTPGSVVTGSSATVSGSAFTSNYYAYVYYQRPDGTYNAFYVNTNATGSFSFPLGFLATHGTGVEYVSAYDYATARWAPFATIAITSAAPASQSLVLAASPNPARVGASTMVAGTGFTPNQYVYVYWRRPDGTTGSTFAYTSTKGAFSFPLQFLTTHGTGTESVRAFDYGVGLYSAPIAVTVTM